MADIEIKMPEGFEAVSVLGKGAMGTVYKAWQPKLKRHVAVKTCTVQESLSAGQDIGRLEDEALTIAQLNHPNIVSLIDVFRDDEAIYLIMEFLDGPPLSRILNPKNSIEALGQFAEMVEDVNGIRVMREEWILEVAHSVGKALSYAHERNVLHRDIKPANIILTESRNVKLLDFSIARNVNQEKGRTVAGTIFGTVQYMSPEQILSADLDGRTDLYSLGCTLYHLATSSVPFVDDNEITVCMNHVNTPPVPVSNVNNVISSTTAQMIMKCLEKEPEDRYENSEEYAKQTKNMLRALTSGTDFSPVNATDTGEFNKVDSSVESGENTSSSEYNSKFENPKEAVEELNQKLLEQKEKLDSQAETPGVNDLDTIDENAANRSPSSANMSSAETITEDDSTKGKVALTEPSPAVSKSSKSESAKTEEEKELESFQRTKKKKKKRGLEELATRGDEFETKSSLTPLPEVDRPSNLSASSSGISMMKSATSYEPKSVVGSLIDAKTAELKRQRQKQKKMMQQIIAVIVFVIFIIILYVLRFR